MKYLLLFLAGCVAGTVNVLAGGGSFLTVAVMIFMGLPPTVANGTNRVAILVQNVVAVKKFRDFNVLVGRETLWMLIPALAGAGVGAYLASVVADETFKRLLAIFIILVSFVTLYNPKERLKGLELPEYAISVLFFLIGVYGGFVQAGVGFFILAALTLAGFDLVRANAVKVLVILAFTVVALSIFTVKGKVDLLWGIPLALGNATGAYVGVRLAVEKGHGFIRKVVLVALVVVAVKLLLF